MEGEVIGSAWRRPTAKPFSQLLSGPTQGKAGWRNPRPHGRVITPDVSNYEGALVENFLFLDPVDYHVALHGGGFGEGEAAYIELVG